MSANLQRKAYGLNPALLTIEGLLIRKQTGNQLMKFYFPPRSSVTGWWYTRNPPGKGLPLKYLRLMLAAFDCIIWMRTVCHCLKSNDASYMKWMENSPIVQGQNASRRSFPVLKDILRSFLVSILWWIYLKHRVCLIVVTYHHWISGNASSLSIACFQAKPHFKYQAVLFELWESVSRRQGGASVLPASTMLLCLIDLL